MEDDARIAPQLLRRLALQLDGILLGLSQHLADKRTVTKIQSLLNFFQFLY